MKKTKIVLIRHGKTAWNLEKRIQGKTDIPLLPEAEIQVKNMIPKIQNLEIKAIYTSTLKRAQRTGEIIQEGLKITDLFTIEDLCERDYGNYEGKTMREISCTKGYISLDHNLIGAETVEELKNRTIKALSLIAGKHTGETVLVVSHGGSMRTVLKHAGKTEIESIPNNMPFVLEIYENNFTLLKTPEDFA